MARYRIDVRIAGTAYIEAGSQQEAAALIEELKLNGITIGCGDRDIQTDVPGVAIAAAATCYGAFDDDDLPELVEVTP